MNHHTTLKLVPLWLAPLKTSECAEFGPPNTKESDVLFQNVWCFIPKCVFSETDHHTALKLGPLQLTHLKTSGSAEFGHLNTKKVVFYSKNVFYQKQIIIQLWNLDHCNWHTWKPQGLLSLALQIQRKVMFYSKMCFFFSEMDHCITLRLVPLWSACLETSVCT